VPLRLKIRDTGRLALDLLGGTYVVQLLRPALNLVAGAIIARGLGFIAYLIAARVLGPQDFGRLTGLQAIVAIGAAISGLGVAVIAPRTIAQLRIVDPQEARRVAGSLLAMTVGGGCLVALLSVLVGGSVLATVQVQGLVVATVGLAVASALSATLTSVLYGLEATGDVAVANVARGILTMIAVVTQAANGLSAVVVALLVVEVAVMVVTGALLARPRDGARFLVRFRLERRDLRMLWQLGMPALIGSAAVLPSMWLGQALLSSQPGGLHALGLFGLAYRFYLVILFVPAAITPLVLPALARTLAEQRSSGTYRRLLRANLALNVGLAAVLALVVAGSAPVLAGLGGSDYAGARPIIVVLAIAALAAGLNNVLGQAAISLGRIRAWLLSDLVLAVGLALSAVVLVPRLLGPGLAVAYLVGMVATCVALVPAVLRGLRLLGKGVT
jgi:O-antigen/teichoic acid export membrane protein